MNTQQYPTVHFNSDSNIAKYQSEAFRQGLEARTEFERIKSDEKILLAEKKIESKKDLYIFLGFCFFATLVFRFLESDSFREINAQKNKNYVEQLKIKKAVIERELAEMEMNK
jgi:hypothetical protein